MDSNALHGPFGCVSLGGRGLEERESEGGEEEEGSRPEGCDVVESIEGSVEGMNAKKNLMRSIKSLPFLRRKLQ